VQQLEITTDGTYKSTTNVFDKCLLQRSEKRSLVLGPTDIAPQLSRSSSGFTSPHEQLHCLAASTHARIQLPEQGGFCDQIVGAGIEPACSISKTLVLQHFDSRYVFHPHPIQVLISCNPRHAQCSQHHVLS